MKLFLANVLLLLTLFGCVETENRQLSLNTYKPKTLNEKNSEQRSDELTFLNISAVNTGNIGEIQIDVDLSHEAYATVLYGNSEEEIESNKISSSEPNISHSFNIGNLEPGQTLYYFVIARKSGERVEKKSKFQKTEISEAQVTDLHTHSNAASVSAEVNSINGWITEYVNIESIMDSSYPNNNYAIKISSTGGNWDRVAIPFTGEVGQEVTIKLVAKKGQGEHQRIAGATGIANLTGPTEIDSSSYQEYILTGTLTQEDSVLRIYAHGNDNGAAAGNSVYIAQLEILTGTSSNNSDTQAPSVPTGLASNSVSEDSLSFSWNSSTDNVAVVAYVIEQDGAVVASTTSTNYTVSGLNAGTAYSYRVAARDAMGNQSAFSQSLSITTNSVDQCMKADPGLSLSPASISAQAGDSISFTVSLQNNNQNCPDEVFNLSHENLPSGFNSNLPASRSLSSGASTTIPVSISIPSSQAAGSFTIGVKAESGAYSATQNLSLALTEANGGDSYDLHTYSNAASVSNEVNSTTGWVTESANIESIADSSYPNNNYAIKVSSTGGNWDRVAIPFEGEVGTDITIKIVAKKGQGDHQGIYGSSGISGLSGPTDIDSTSYQEYVLTGTLSSAAPVLRIYAHANDSGASSTNSVYVASVEIIGIPAIIDTEAPSVPQNLSSSGLSPYSVGLSWDASSDNVGVNSYILKQGDTVLGSSSNNSYSVGNLQPETTYSFSVAAVDAAGNQSAFSSTISITTPEVTSSGGLKAFPSAYGAGAYVTGGRGGEVRKVTNLNDSGSGSLREALQGEEPKIIVFGVSGTIKLLSDLFIKDNTTIAGQTAPAGGITLSAYNNAKIRCTDSSNGPSFRENIIVRYIKVRPQYSGVDAIKFYRCRKVIFDHVSAAWGGDEVISFTGYQSDVSDITVQRMLIAEGKTGSLLGDSDSSNLSSRLSMHNSLFYNITHRFPNINSGGRADILNNVIFNYQYRMTSANGNMQLNMANNYYKRVCFGDPSYEEYHRITGTRSTDPIKNSMNAKIYDAGNLVMPSYHTDPNADTWYMWRELYESGGSYINDPLPLSFRQNSMFTPLLGAELPLLSAQAAHDNVLADVGANKRLDENGNIVASQDSIDLMYIANAIAGACVPYQSSSSGQNYTSFAHYQNFHNSISSTPIATGYLDTDNDGMPNAWEQANGFDPNVDDSAGDADGDGYTNIEEFLNLIDQ